MTTLKRGDVESTTDFALRLSQRQEKVRRRARQLELAGPDEFPSGYYRHLAEVQIADEEARGG